MRRYLVQERGEFPPQLQSAFRGLETNANPWNFAASDRGHWSEGMDIKLLAENPHLQRLKERRISVARKSLAPSDTPPEAA